MIEAYSVRDSSILGLGAVQESIIATLDIGNQIESGTGLDRVAQPDIKNQEEPSFIPITQRNTKKTIDSVIADLIINASGNSLGTLEADLVRNFYDNNMLNTSQNDIHLQVYIAIPYSTDKTQPNSQPLAGATVYVIADSLEQAAPERLYVIESPTIYEDVLTSQEGEYAGRIYETSIYVPSSFVSTYTSTRNQDVIELFSELYIKSNSSDDLESQLASTSTHLNHATSDNTALYLTKTEITSPRKNPKDTITNRVKKIYKNLTPKYHNLNLSDWEERSIDRNMDYPKSQAHLQTELAKEDPKREPLIKYKREDLCAVKPDSELIETELGSMYRLRFNGNIDNIQEKRVVGIKVHGKTQNKSVDGYSALAQLDALAEMSGYEFFFEETANGTILRSISGNGSKSYTIKIVDKENPEHIIRYLSANLESEKVDFDTQQVVIEQATDPQNISAKIFNEQYVEAIYTRSGKKIGGVGTVSYFKGQAGETEDKNISYTDENGNKGTYQINTNSILAAAIQSLEASGYSVELKRYELRKDGEIIGEGITIEDIYKDGVSLKDNDCHSGYLIETISEEGYVGEPIDANGNLMSLEEATAEEGQLYRIVVSQQGVYDRNEINEDLTEEDYNNQSDEAPSDNADEVEENYDEKDESPEEATDQSE